MQKLPEAFDMGKEKELSRQKKDSRSLSVVTSGVTTPKSFFLVVEGVMCLSLGDAALVAATSFTNDTQLIT